MPALDATVLVDADRQNPTLLKKVQKYINEEEPLVVPIQAAIEYCTGRKDPAAGLRRLRASFWVVACDEEIALEAARLARAAIEEGKFPGWTDVQIAATARVLGLDILTRNPRHFQPLQVRVESY